MPRIIHVSKIGLIILISFYIYPSDAQLPDKRDGYSIVIDTDAGVDDYRALSLIFSRPEIAVKGITISDGNLPPESGYKKVIGIIGNAGMDSVPVGSGKTVPGIEPEWRKFNQSLIWGNKSLTSKPLISSHGLLAEIIGNNTSGITVLCLGPLTNVAELLEKMPDAVSGIERIIWYNENVENKSGFNYLADVASAGKVLNSGIRIDILSNLNLPGASFNLSVLAESQDAKTIAAKLIYDFYDSNHIPAERFNNQLALMDELVVVYLLRPELFDMKTLPGNRNVRVVQDFNLRAVHEVIQDIMFGFYSHETHIAFAGFPLSAVNYNYDVRQIMDDAIILHGLEEWKASVITNELHRHLGIYSLLGVKMGIYALELLGAQRDLIQVHSFAGNKPPYSCLNDGLQVSTGATLGMGTISVSDDQNIGIAANFNYKGKTIHISLKPEYLEQVEADISEGIVKYGLTDDGYWKLIRRAALRYWLEWKREKIFNVKKYTQ